MPGPSIPDKNRLNVSWLVRLRWAEIVGQAITIAVADVVLPIRFPLEALAAIVLAGLVSNLALERGFGLRGHRSRPVEIAEWQLAGVMALDVALLTALLYFTGGPHNPFGFLYVVQIALATLLLGARWTWALAALSFVGFGLLVLHHRPLPVADSTRMVGMWVALGVASAFVAHFLLRIASALGERERELAAAKNLTARQERLASLATMAAGAAHELSTPLGTVALVAKELERHLVGLGDPRLVEDARLIREQVGRCRAILDQMAGGAGAAGEGVETRQVSALLDEALRGVRDLPEVRRDVGASTARAELRLPPRAVTQALRSLVTNAQDASPAGQPVTVAAALVDSQLAVTITDRGRGMDVDALARIGEPFYTTKEPGRGMGLGLFLARAVIEGVGGTLTISSKVDAGTEVRVVLPLSITAERHASAHA